MITTPLPPHLQPTRTDRGFLHMPPIPATHGGEPAGQVFAYESSSAMAPHLWLAVEQPADRNNPDNGQTIKAVVHVTAEDAWKLADQLRTLVINHYQGNARPDWAQD